LASISLRLQETGRVLQGVSPSAEDRDRRKPAPRGTHGKPISQKFDIEQTNASQQLAVLRHANIISARKEGTKVYYSVKDAAIFKMLEAATLILEHELQNFRHMLEDV